MRISAITMVLAFGLGLMGGCSKTPEKAAVAQSTETAPVAAAAAPVTGTTRVIAYYFHGTVRCQTCLTIEKQAKELMETRFAGQVTFKPVNYDQPENAHFSKDYKLPCPSLVLVRHKNGKDEDWKLLGQTWDNVEIPPKLDQYIEEQTRSFLEATQ